MELSTNGRSLLKINLKDIDEKGHFRVPDGVVEIGLEPAKTRKSVVASRKATAALKTIDLNGVRTIRDFAFYYCTNLEKIIGSPKSISAEAFSCCFKLREFDFSETDRVGPWSFRSSGLVSADIRKVKDIGFAAFCQCEKLEKIIGSPEIIPENTFNGCKKLENFDFSNVNKMGYSAFGTSGLSDKITETDKTISVNCGDFKYLYVRLSTFYLAHKAGSIINENKNAYTDEFGNPFVFDLDGNIVTFKNNRKRFEELYYA